jgi:hypothetical protein
VAAQVGYCGLDRRRLPLTGAELRGCWQAGPARNLDQAAADASPDDPIGPASAALRLRDFVPVELLRHDAPRPRPAEAPPTSNATPTPDPMDRVTLFAESEI